MFSLLMVFFKNCFLTDFYTFTFYCIPYFLLPLGNIHMVRCFFMERATISNILAFSIFILWFLILCGISGGCAMVKMNITFSTSRNSGCYLQRHTRTLQTYKEKGVSTIKSRPALQAMLIDGSNTRRFSLFCES